MTRQGQFIKRQKSDKNNGHIPDPTISATLYTRPPSFQYPSLPRLEIVTYFLIVLCSILYAWLKLFFASEDYDWENQQGSGRYEIGDWPVTIPGVDDVYLKDVSNHEWRVWTPFAARIIPWLVGHCLLFNIAGRILPVRIWWWVMFIYWILAHYYLAGAMVLFISVALGVAVFIVAGITNSKLLTWMAALVLLYANVHNPFLISTLHTPDGLDLFIAMATFSFKILQYLSFLTEMLDAENQEKKTDENGPKKTKWNYFSSGNPALNMFWYSFYLPSSYFLVITYKRFLRNLSHRSSDQSIDRSLRNALIFGLRIFFWYLISELILRFFYFEALILDHDYLSYTPIDTLISVGYAMCKFYHLKYVIIFGLPAFFSRLDNMEPFDGPICLTRVALNSKIWRYFDRGLHDFFKEHIYLPICRPDFSLWRRLTATMVCYISVLGWYGTSHKYFIWIILSLAAIFLEKLAKAIYGVPKYRNWREEKISDRHFRRLLALAQIFPLILGFYSSVYFLGSSQSGYIFVKRIFWETMRLKWSFLVLMVIGYSYCNVCMEVDRWISGKAKKICVKNE